MKPAHQRGPSVPERMAEAIARHALLWPGERVLVGLSGGADSVALLAGLRALGYSVEAAHCNFHLRGTESDRDEDFCRTLCTELGGVPLHVAHFDTPAEARRTGESVEMAARRLRYGWFAALLRERGIRRVAVAHHRDDNVETLLLNLIRGTGIHGLRGMKPENGVVVRPLLDIPRADLLLYINNEGLNHVTDSTNADTAFKRNRVRHVLLPLLRTFNPSVDDTLAETARRMSDAEALYRLGLEAATSRLTRRPDGGMDIPLGAGRPPRAALFEWLTAAGFPSSVTAELLDGPPPRDGALFAGKDRMAVVHRGQLEVRPRPVPFESVMLNPEGQTLLPDGRILQAATLPAEDIATLPRSRTVASLDADRLRGPLRCRSTAVGDRFAPFGMKGTKLVSDYLTNRGFSRLDRMAAAVVTDDKGIVWLVGERPDSRAAVTASTRRVVRISLCTPEGSEASADICPPESKLSL